MYRIADPLCRIIQDTPRNSCFSAISRAAAYASVDRGGAPVHVVEVDRNKDTGEERIVRIARTLCRSSDTEVV